MFRLCWSVRSETRKKCERFLCISEDKDMSYLMKAWWINCMCSRMTMNVELCFYLLATAADIMEHSEPLFSLCLSIFCIRGRDSFSTRRYSNQIGIIIIFYRHTFMGQCKLFVFSYSNDMHDHFSLQLSRQSVRAFNQMWETCSK